MQDEYGKHLQAHQLLSRPTQEHCILAHHKLESALQHRKPRQQRMLLSLLPSSWSLSYPSSPSVYAPLDIPSSHLSLLALLQLNSLPCIQFLLPAGILRNHLVFRHYPKHRLLYLLLHNLDCHSISGRPRCSRCSMEGGPAAAVPACLMKRALKSKGALAAPSRWTMPSQYRCLNPVVAHRVSH